MAEAPAGAWGGTWRRLRLRGASGRLFSAVSGAAVQGKGHLALVAAILLLAVLVSAIQSFDMGPPFPQESQAPVPITVL